MKQILLMIAVVGSIAAMSVLFYAARKQRQQDKERQRREEAEAKKEAEICKQLNESIQSIRGIEELEESECDTFISSILHYLEGERPRTYDLRDDLNSIFYDSERFRSGRAGAATSGPTFEPWGFCMSKEFQKAIKGIDRKLAGRILGAMTELIQNPTEAKGNTLKPLTGSMSGLWRLRIGDYRLIYQPVMASKQILILNFGGRGAVYPPKGR